MAKLYYFSRTSCDSVEFFLSVMCGILVLFVEQFLFIGWVSVTEVIVVGTTR